MTFVDTDARIEAEAGMAISQIFAERGEPWFRTEEERVLTAIAGGDQAAVVATGGGVVLSEVNRSAMNEALLACGYLLKCNHVADRRPDESPTPLLRQKSVAPPRLIA